MFNSSSNKIEKEFENLRNELLDLTLRNQLLNFKLRAKTIAIENQSSTNIFQNLVLQNKKMYFEANKKEENKDKSRFSIWDHSPIDFSKFGEGDKTLKTNLTPNELQKRLFYINNQAKTMLQEQGYNILYLAVGFLEWKDNKKPNQKNLAPLILIPVTIERKKVGKSFELSWTGEEIQTNISLKAKLDEVGIELPEFEFKRYGEVLDHYIKNVRDLTSHMKGWKVNSNIALGFFSFTKFVMYNDLNPESWDDNVDLTQKELIQAIFNPEVNNQEAFKEEDIDSQLDYGSMYQVLDADSSQIAAIEDVKAGRNLVVEGPPGTGKSQTIVNLIAELLAEGKTVLFVSEKMAALEVVKERLQQVGLGKFVLELHSHKTRRKKFLKDLEKAANVRAEEPLNIEPTIRKLETLKRELDNYPEIIHEKYYGVNLSPFELYGMKEDAEAHFVKKQALLPLVKFDKPELITIKDLDDMAFALENVAELFQTISSENPWSSCSPKSLLPADLREIEILIIDTLHALDDFMVERQIINDNFGIQPAESLTDFSNSLDALKIIDSNNLSMVDPEVISTELWKLDNNDPFVLIDNLEKYQKFSNILEKFNENIFQVNIDELISEVQKLANKKFRLFKSKQNEEVVEAFYTTQIPNTEQILRDLNTVKVVLESRQVLYSSDALAKQYFGRNWSIYANVEELRKIANSAKEFWKLIDNGVFSQQTIQLISQGSFNFNVNDTVSNYIQYGEKFKDKLSKLISKLNPNTELIFKNRIDDVTLVQWKNQLSTWRGQLSSLHLWSQYLNTKQSLHGTYSEPFVDVIERRNIKKEDVRALVNGNFADSLLNLMFLDNPTLATFIGELHENKIKEFKDLDRKILELNRKRIFHKLNKNIPNIFGGAQGSEAQILAGEFTRKSGHLPVRKLLQKAGGLIKQIKPVFMMSPLSIAQYLDPTNEKLQFDVVIFDEASQVKPQDALGAFMRAKTAVVMGDTQQLPPTSFFEQMADGESYEEEATSLDMESILHLCKLSFPVKMLKWHYRSRHESLISVSNSQFYDDELLVYPSPSHNDPELGLKLHYSPDTFYDRGSSAANVGEAKEVVKAIFEHFEKYGDTKSLGVGTFSVSQKNAILEELELQRKNRPELEPLFSENKEERFFVKNLETIQGDERDVILISVGYGFDQERKMSLNFGPLNQDGGERRLNVLITRAREKCVVFSNFKSTDMHLTENPPYGVKSLREFLYYAENVTNGNRINPEKKEQKFEDSIAKFLEENGYKVDRQIGCAGFRVDLAIVDEENPGQYFLGITTDGETYNSSKVARDRNRLREQVLEGLGWNIYHLWSTDWYRNRDLGRNKLLNAIEEARLKHRKDLEFKKLEEQKRVEEIKGLLEEYSVEDENETEYDFYGEDGEIIIDSPYESKVFVKDTIGQNEDITVENNDGTISVEKIEKQDVEPSITIKDDLEPVVNVEDIKDDFFNEVDNEDLKENSVQDSSTPIHNKNNSQSEEIEDGYSKGDYVEGNSQSKDTESEVVFNNHINLNEENSSSDVNNSIDDENKFIEVDDDENQNIEIIEEVDVSGEDKSNDGPHLIDSSDKKNESSKQFKKDNEFKKKPKFKGKIINDFKKSEPKPDDGIDNSKVQQNNVYSKDSESVVEREVDKSSQNFADIDDDLSIEVERPSNNPIIKNDKKERKGIVNSIIDSLKGETKLNVSGNKTYDDEGNEVFIPEVEVNEAPVKPPSKKKKVIDVVVDSSSNGNVFDKDEATKEMANKLVDDVFDDILSDLDTNIDDSFNGSSSENFTENSGDFVSDESSVINDKEDIDEVSYVVNSVNDSNQKEEWDNDSVDDYEEDYYQTSKDIKNPLRKDNIATDKKEGKGIRKSISKFKDDVSYINNSLKEIENPSQSDYITTIDRTDFIEDEENIIDTEKELRDEYFEEKDLAKSIQDEIENDETEVIVPIHNEVNNDEEIKLIDYEKFEDLDIDSTKDIYENSPENKAVIVNKIVDVESPVHIDEVVKRIREHSDIKRAGTKFKEAIVEGIEYCEKEGNITNVNDFLFSNSNKQLNVRKRVKPNIELISEEEIEKNIIYILSNNDSFESSKLAKEASHNFGFKSNSKKTANKINNVLDSMIADGRVILDGDNIKLN